MGGYGSISASTKTDDIVCIADVDIKHFDIHVDYHNIDSPRNYNEALIKAYMFDMVDGDSDEYDELYEYLMIESSYSLFLGDAIKEQIEEFIENARDLKLKENITWDNVKEFNEYVSTAEGILEYIKEINFVYHPWVTVEEIQRSRRYNPPVRRGRDQSAAGGKKKRRRLEFVDLFPKLRL